MSGEYPKRLLGLTLVVASLVVIVYLSTLRLSQEADGGWMPSG